MPLHVICPGCLKRFQVSDRFAGKQGPCPNCNTIISIPDAPVRMHDTEEGELEKHGGQRALYRPIPRIDMDFDLVQTGQYALSVVSILFFTVGLGWISMPVTLRSLLGFAGLCAVAFPLTLFGYQVMRDREQLFIFTGRELYRRAAITAASYVFLWIVFEYMLITSGAEAVVSWIYFAAFACLGSLITHAVFEMNQGGAFLHYCIFGFSIALLRFFIGFGWFWLPNEMIRYGVIPPPPVFPGM
jgi:hypothetical protein